ncbi:MAG: hypothetical protein QNJ91_13475 [Gammaproteobacteria bacterium]|nr:hypothetical protein [Gammaproteobacteria bacterium]
MYLGPQDTIKAERRGNRPPIPADVDSQLTQEQRLALHKVEDFGWQLAFVRRPLFQSAVAVVTSPDHERYAVLETDGELNMQPDIVIRH